MSLSLNNYFDNAATSFPKPEAVGSEINRYLNKVGGPYGRSFYPRAVEVSRTVENCRDLLSAVIGAANPDNLVFTANATQAINTVLRGLSLEGREVWISPLEHNAVMRPLKYLEKSTGLTVCRLPVLSGGLVDTAALSETDLSRAALIIICHQSNVTGLIQPVVDIKKAVGGIPLLLDAAQSAGHTEIHADEWNIDYIAFTGHKGLLGPTGTGGLYMKNPELVEPLLNGGTGSRSDSFDSPAFQPDRFEAGTHNIAGIFGLYGAMSEKPDPRHSRNDFIELIKAAAGIEGLTVYSAPRADLQGEVFSVSCAFASVSDFGTALYEDWGIETRIGLHCAPLAHRCIGSFPEGTVRIAPSVYHSPADFDRLYNALKRTTVKLGSAHRLQQDQNAEAGRL